MSQPTAQGPAASAPGASLPPNSTDLFTYTHLALIALFALVVIVAIIAGMRRAKRRRQGLAEVQADNALIEQAPDRPVPAPTPAADPLPLAASPPPVATATAPVAQAPGTGGNPAAGPVTQLKGLGPKLATRLAELGVTTVGQLAALTADEAVALDGQLGSFAGRLHRDRWQEQARFLAAGDQKGFEAVFGKL